MICSNESEMSNGLAVFQALRFMKSISLSPRMP